MRAKARSWAVTVLVAGTASSGPASRQIAAWAVRARSLSASLVIAMPAAPALWRRRRTVTISGVRPDCEAAMTRTPR